MNNIFVICEMDEGKVADVSLELLTKGRSLANTLKCQLEALVLGHKLTGVEKRYSLMGLTWCISEMMPVWLPIPPCRMRL